MTQKMNEGWAKPVAVHGMPHMVAMNDVKPAV
jgi:hypothetical protein